MKNYLYITINKLNTSECYIGITLKSISSGYKGSGSHILKMFKMYGKSNFQRIDLGCFENRYEAHYWEKFYIKLFKTHISQGGYNISWTGGTFNGQHSEETITLMREKSKGKNKGIKQTEQAIQRRIESMGDPWNKGKEWPKEMKEIMKNSHLGKSPSEITRQRMSKAHKKSVEQ